MQPVEFLTAEEAEALLKAPDPATWIGRRDQALLRVALQTGLRNAEITSLRRQDVQLGTGAHVRCLGKGRKQRCTPLRPDVATHLGQWLLEQPAEPTSPVFSTARGNALSPDALQRLVARHWKSAAQVCPSLKTKHVTPHSLRHTAAMELLRRGVDLTVIALWLGHESTQTTQTYLHADIVAKGTSPRPCRSEWNCTQTLLSSRPAAEVPGEPVIMPTSGARENRRPEPGCRRRLWPANRQPTSHLVRRAEPEPCAA